MDFAYDQTADCRTLKHLNVTDEFTRRALAIEVERSMAGDDIVTVLERLIRIHGAPGFVRMDNCTEMTSNAVAEWCRFSPTGIVFIDPGSPWQNAYVESYTGRLRDQLLGVEIFHALLEAKVMAEDYRQQYNARRPHSSLSPLTPDEFAVQWSNTHPGPTHTLAHQPGAGHGSWRPPASVADIAITTAAEVSAHFKPTRQSPTGSAGYI